MEAAGRFCLSTRGSGIDRRRGREASALSHIADAVNRLITPDALRKEFLAHGQMANTLYRAVKPDPAVRSGSGDPPRTDRRRDSERTDEAPGDISGVMTAINALLDRSIAADGFRIRERMPGETAGPAHRPVSIDFEVLAKRFAKSKRKNVELEQLRAAVRGQFRHMVALNQTRADYLSRFEALISPTTRAAGTLTVYSGSCSP